MHVIGHQTVTSHPQLVTPGVSPQELEVLAAVGFAEKQALAVVATLDNVIRDAFGNQTWSAWHASNSTRRRTRPNRPGHQS